MDGWSRPACFTERTEMKQPSHDLGQHAHETHYTVDLLRRVPENPYSRKTHLPGIDWGLSQTLLTEAEAKSDPKLSRKLNVVARRAAIRSKAVKANSGSEQNLLGQQVLLGARVGFRPRVGFRARVRAGARVGARAART